MYDLVRLGLRSGFRTSGFKGLLLAAALLIGSAMLASSFSGRQPMTVAFDVGLTGMRLVLLLMALFWVQDLLARDIERKSLYFMLAYPISRLEYLLARFITMALLCAVATLLLGGLLLLALWLSSGEYQQLTPPVFGGRYALVLVGIWLDLLVVIAFTLLLSTFSTTPFLPMLLGLAFALAARGLGPSFDYLRHDTFADPAQVRWFKPLLDHSYAWLPDLSRLDWRPLALYGLPVELSTIGLGVLMAVGYIALLLLVAVMVFERRDFT